MYFLLYTSNPTKPISTKELKELLSASVRNNEKMGITGMLLYLNNTFMQVIEGNEDDVNELFDKIVNDDRHHKIFKLMEGFIANPFFLTWSMGFKHLHPAEAATLPGFNDVSQFFSEQRIQESGEPALVFLKLFYKKNQNDYPTLLNTPA